MSVRVMTAVWALALPDSEKLVLLALADCANDEGHCWPSMATLARKCSKSDRTVQAAIKSLVEAGHLTRREVPGKGCNYTVHPRSDFTPEATSPRSHDTTPPKPVRDTPEAASDKPSKNHQEPLKGSRKRSAKPPFEIPGWVPAEPWAAFDAMRLEMRHKWPWGDNGRKLTIAELDRLRGEGHCPVKVLNRAVQRGYRGIFGNEETRATGGRKLTEAEQREQAQGRIAFFEKIGKQDEADALRRKWGTGPPPAVAELVGKVGQRVGGRHG